MKILGIETSSNIGGVAICDENIIIAEQSFEKGMHHGKELIPAIKSLFDNNGLKPKDIDLISVSVGPGSYTGLRVGIACAKTLSYTLKKPLIDVPSMDVIAQNVRVRHKFICPVIDAKRKMVYATIYEYSPDDQLHYLCPGNRGSLSTQTENDERLSINLWKRRSGLSIISPYEIINRLPTGTFVFGDGVSRYAKVFENRNVLMENNDVGTPKASIVTILGKHAYDKGKRCDTNSIQPLYLQKPEAIGGVSK